MENNIWCIKEIVDNILYFIPWAHMYEVSRVNKLFKDICEHILKKRRIEEYKIWEIQKVKYREERNIWVNKRKQLTENEKRNIDRYIDTIWLTHLRDIDYKEYIPIERYGLVFNKLIKLYNEGGQIYLYVENYLSNYFYDAKFCFFNNNIFANKYIEIFKIITILTNDKSWIDRTLFDLRDGKLINTLVKLLINYEKSDIEINIFCLYILEIIISSNNVYNYNLGNILSLFIIYDNDHYTEDKKDKIHIFEEIQMKAIRLLCYNKKIRYKIYNLCNKYINKKSFKINEKMISIKMLYTTYDTIMFMYKNRYIKKLEYKILVLIISDTIKVFLNKFLFNKNIRKFLIYLLQNDGIRKMLLTNYVEFIFDLCKKRERKIMINFIKLEFNTIKKLKYRDTNESIYFFALKQKGCMHNIIEDLKNLGLNK